MRVTRRRAGDYDAAVALSLEMVPDPALAIDETGRIVACNDRARSLLGATVGRLAPDVFPGMSLARGEDQRVLARSARGSIPVHISVGEAFATAGALRLVVVRDASSAERVEALASGEKAAFEALASGRSTEHSLLPLIRVVESVLPGARVFVCISDGDGILVASDPDKSIDLAPSAEVVAGEVDDHATRVDVRTVKQLRDVRGLLKEHGLIKVTRLALTDETGAVGAVVVFEGMDAFAAPTTGAFDALTRVSLIAAARRKQDALRKIADVRYGALSELTSDFAYSFSIRPDGSATLDWVTEAFERVTGYTLDEWRGMGGWRGLVHPDDLLAFEGRLPRLRRGDSVSGDVRIVTKAGSIRWLTVVGRPVMDGGNLVGIIGAAQDFTQRKEAEDAKTLFLATASHELKTPLTVISGWSQLLTRSDKPASTEMEGLEAIERRAQQLNKIVDRILLSSRIESGRVQVNLERVDLLPILQERVSALASATQREVRVDAESDLPAVSADPDAFTTVLDHLLDNAVKYSPDGGPIFVRAEQVGGLVWVLVRDFGIGMTGDQVTRCCEKFWQAESSDVRRFGGTGIGLFIVRSLVEAMGGTVHIESAPGEGSAFAMSFRRASDEPASDNVGKRDSIREFMRQIGVRERRIS